MKMKIINALAVCGLLLSCNVYALESNQQKIVLKTTTAHLVTDIKLSCATCTNITKQDDHTYFINYNFPNTQDWDHMTFTYQYGSGSDSCIYNADVRFALVKKVGFWCEGNQSSVLDPKSTSKACPTTLALFANSNNNITEILVN